MEIYKRSLNLIILLFEYALLLPIWLMIWTFVPMFIWLKDRGPIFYKQRQPGIYVRVLIAHKSLTMISDANLKGPAWTIPGDPRLTRIGKFLSRFDSDGFLELWSVLKGDMRFVGPRPLDEMEQAQWGNQIPGFHHKLLLCTGTNP